MRHRLQHRAVFFLLDVLLIRAVPADEKICQSAISSLRRNLWMDTCRNIEPGEAVVALANDLCHCGENGVM